MIRLSLIKYNNYVTSSNKSLENMNEKFVSERIAQMVEYFRKGNKSAFAKAVGISNQSLGEIVGSRQSAPSFAALQKILLAFPEVRIEWLVLGQGLMLNKEPEEAQGLSLAATMEHAREAFSSYIQEYIESGKLQKQVVAERAKIESPEYQLQLRQMYTVLDSSPSRHKRHLLSDRLAISEEDAEQLVLSGSLPAMKISDTAGYRVSEEWIREYLAGTVETTRSLHEHHAEGEESLLEKLLMPEGHHYTNAEREKLLNRAKPAKK